MEPMQWPADQVERRPLAALIPRARNVRTHSDAQVAQIAASIREWGWTMPILVDEAGTIIAGHGRVLAAARLDLDEVPVMVARDWSEAGIRPVWGPTDTDQWLWAHDPGRGYELRAPRLASS